MKMMKHIIISALCLLVISDFCFAQSNEVKLVVCSDGPTKEEATKNALRSAIEQAYGTFVSTNTEILNDELVKDEIVTVSSGNIKSYKEVSSITMPDGGYSVTLSAVVSIGKLVSYAQSKGAKAEFAGQAFLQEMKMRQLNKENELQAIRNLVKVEKELLSKMYDFELVLGDPYVKESNYILPVSILLYRNENYKEAYNLFTSTFDNLSLSASDRQAWSNNGLSVTSFDKWYLRNTGYVIANELNQIRDSWIDAAHAWCLCINEITKHEYSLDYDKYGEYKSSNELNGRVYGNDARVAGNGVRRAWFSGDKYEVRSHEFDEPIDSGRISPEKLNIYIELTPEEIGALKSVELVPSIL